MSVTPLAISIEADAPPEMLGAIEALLADESATHLGYPLRVQQFCAVLRNENSGFEGGIYARAYWEWMRIDMLAVAPEWRGRGYGRMLLLRAEEWALCCACHDAWLMTMGEDARRFWNREGLSGIRRAAELSRHADPILHEEVPRAGHMIGPR